MTNANTATLPRAKNTMNTAPAATPDVRTYQELPIPAVQGAPNAGIPPITGVYQSATNSTSSTSAPPASEYVALEMIDTTERPLPQPSSTPPSTQQNQYGVSPQPAPGIAYFPLDGGPSPEGQYGLTPDALARGRQKQDEQQRRANYQPLAATQQYGGIPQTTTQYGGADSLIGARDNAVAARPLPANPPQPQPFTTGNNTNNLSPTTTTFTPAPAPTPPAHVAIDISADAPALTTAVPTPAARPDHVIDIPADASSGDNTSSSGRIITDNKYHLTLTDQILTDDIKRTDNLRAQRMIAGSIFANMGLPASEIDKLLDKAFVASLDSAEFKSLEGARLIKLREIIAEIYKGGTKDINTINKEIKETANKFLTRIGAKKLNNEKYVADNFSDIEEIKKESLERANKLLSESLDKNGSKEWNEAVIDSITNEIDYPKMIRDKHSDMLKENSKEETFNSRMQLFGGAFGTGAAFYIIIQLLFPPAAFVGALLLIFAFVGAVVTVLAEGLSKILTGITKFILGIAKLATGLVVGCMDLIRSVGVGIANLFIKDPSKKFEYFTLTPAALKVLDKIQNSIFEDNQPKFSEKNPERFITNRDGLQGKLDAISTRADISPTPVNPSRPTPMLTPVTPAPISPILTPNIVATPTSPVTPTPVATSTAAIAAAAADPIYGQVPGFSRERAAAAAASATPQPSNVSPEQLQSATSTAKAMEQKNNAEAKLRGNPDAASKAELNRLIAESEGIIAREREKNNQPLVPVSPATLVPIHIQIGAPLRPSRASASTTTAIPPDAAISFDTASPNQSTNVAGNPPNTQYGSMPTPSINNSGRSSGRRPPLPPGSPKTPNGAMPTSNGDGVGRQ